MRGTWRWLSVLLLGFSLRAGAQAPEEEIQVSADWLHPSRDGDELGCWDYAWRAGLMVVGRHESGLGLGFSLAREEWNFDDGAGPVLFVDALDGGAQYAATLDGGLTVWPVGVHVLYRIPLLERLSIEARAGVEYAWAEDDDADYRVDGSEYFGRPAQPVHYRAPVDADALWRAQLGLELAFAVTPNWRAILGVGYGFDLNNGDIRVRSGGAGNPGAPILEERADLDYRASFFRLGAAYSF